MSSFFAGLCSSLGHPVRQLALITRHLGAMAGVFLVAPEFGRENLGSSRRIAEHSGGLRIGGGEEAGGVGGELSQAGKLSSGHVVAPVREGCFFWAESGPMPAPSGYGGLVTP
jgi:hypothetical protein